MVSYQTMMTVYRPAVVYTCQMMFDAFGGIQRVPERKHRGIVMFGSSESSRYLLIS